MKTMPTRTWVEAAGPGAPQVGVGFGAAGSAVLKKFRKTRYVTLRVAVMEVMCGSAVMVCTGSVMGMINPALSTQPENKYCVLPSSAVWRLVFGGCPGRVGSATKVRMCLLPAGHTNVAGPK